MALGRSARMTLSTRVVLLFAVQLRPIHSRLLREFDVRNKDQRGHPSNDRINILQKAMARKKYISIEDAGYLMFTESTGNHAYNANAGRIGILNKNGKVVDVAEASDQLNIMVLSKPVIRYYLCYPKNMELPAQ